MDEWVDGWVGGWVDAQIDGRMNQHILFPRSKVSGGRGFNLSHSQDQYLHLIPKLEASQEVCTPGRAPSGGCSRTKERVGMSSVYPEAETIRCAGSPSPRKQGNVRHQQAAHGFQNTASCRQPSALSYSTEAFAGSAWKVVLSVL